MDPNDSAPLVSRMGRPTAIFIAIVVGALGLAAVSTQRIDTSLPEITVAGFDGSTWSLRTHAAGDGRPVLVNFWASWCAPCRAEIPEISAFADAHPEIEVVGVAVDDREEPARRLMAELAPSYYTGMDASGRLREHYPSFGLPVTFLIADGEIKARREGAVRVADLEEMIAGM